MSQIVIVGGIVNNVLRRWLQQLSICTYSHVTLNHNANISRENLGEIGAQLRYMLSMNSIVITVGPLASRILSDAQIWHYNLPSTACKDKNKIIRSLDECKQYLTRRRYYVHTSDPTSPKPS